MANVIELLAADAIGIFAGAFLPQPWGIYLGGAPVILANTVLSFDYRQQWSVSDYPVERGAFESYDKVQIPYDARFRMATGGSDADKMAFLDSIAAIAGDLNLYDIVTPDAVYLSCNITHYDYNRHATHGLGLLQVDIWVIEVRETATMAMSNTQSPSNAAQVNGGSVQTAPASSAQAALVPYIVGPPPPPAGFTGF